MGSKGESLEQGPTSAKDLTIERSYHSVMNHDNTPATA